MKVLVLGGAGFLGSHFVEQAVALGHEVTVVDRLPRGTTPSLDGLRSRIRLVSADIADMEAMRPALAGQEVAYHFAGNTTPAATWDRPLAEIEGDLRTAVQLFRLACECGVRKIVFPSSGGTVYGTHTEPVAETAVPAPFSPYGIAKLAAEHFLRDCCCMHGVAFDIYRIGNPYGPRQPAPRPQGVIATWMRAILDGRELQVYGDAGTLRDYVFIDDVAFLMTRSLQDCHASALYNIGTGQGISPLALIEVLRSVVDRPFEFRAHPRRPCDNPAIVLDGRRLLSYFPGFTYTALEEGVARTWRAFKAGPQPS